MSGDRLHCRNLKIFKFFRICREYCKVRIFNAKFGENVYKYRFTVINVKLPQSLHFVVLAAVNSEYWLFGRFVVYSHKDDKMRRLR